MAYLTELEFAQKILDYWETHDTWDYDIEPAERQEIKSGVRSSISTVEKYHWAICSCLYDLTRGNKCNILIDFDAENASLQEDYGPWLPAMGFYKFPDGRMFLGCNAGGDWEHAVYFCVYWDYNRKELCAYIPGSGNIYNKLNNRAFGNTESSRTDYTNYNRKTQTGDVEVPINVGISDNEAIKKQYGLDVEHYDELFDEKGKLATANSAELMLNELFQNLPDDFVY